MAESQRMPISFNVGGTVYTTSFTTLQRCPDSMLARMITQENLQLQKDKSDNIFIDRDGAMFRYILNYLRDGEFDLPLDFAEYGQLSREVNFYQLGDHARGIVAREMREKTAKPATTRHVVMIKRAQHSTTKNLLGPSFVGTSFPNPSFAALLTKKSPKCDFQIYRQRIGYPSSPEDYYLVYASLIREGFRKEPYPTEFEVFVKEEEARV